MVKSASSSAVSSSTDGNSASKTSSPAQQDAAAKPAFDPSNASLNDIQFGRNAYDKANIASPDYLKAMFANPTYSQYLAECQSRLHAKLQAKTVIHEGNVSGMARACEYIMEAAKQPWWNHQEYHAAQELQGCIGKMRVFASLSSLVFSMTRPISRGWDWRGTSRRCSMRSMAAKPRSLCARLRA
jgi:hypothetical protein